MASEFKDSRKRQEKAPARTVIPYFGNYHGKTTQKNRVLPEKSLKNSTEARSAGCQPATHYSRTAACNPLLLHCQPATRYPCTANLQPATPALPACNPLLVHCSLQPATPALQPATCYSCTASLKQHPLTKNPAADRISTTPKKEPPLMSPETCHQKRLDGNSDDSLGFRIQPQTMEVQRSSGPSSRLHSESESGRLCRSACPSEQHRKTLRSCQTTARRRRRPTLVR